MRILVIFTGGTIGSSVQGGWISPDDVSQSKLINLYHQKMGDTGVQFSTLAPYTILSENLSANELNLLVDYLSKEAEKGYDGIIVTHGTDTLQYTAATLGYTLGDRLPILLVSADYPLEDSRSNGLDNFLAAVHFLQARPQGGVYVSYKNVGADRTDIHLATRLLAHAETCADLFSLGGPFASVDNQTGAVVYAPAISLSGGKGLGQASLCAKPSILVLESRPETLYPDNLDGYQAVILAPYHSGTLNTASQDFQAFCKKAKQKGVPVFLVNANNGVTYDSLQSLQELGVIRLPLCAKIAIFVKCWLALSLKKEVKDFVLTPLSNEFLD